jgi:cytochrome c oxidase subunit 2
MYNILSNIIYFDAPSPWGIYFQDSATPQFEGVIELHVVVYKNQTPGTS